MNKTLPTKRFKVGDQFWHNQKFKVIATITDIWITQNLAGEIDKIRYVATHPFNGQTLIDYDVIDTTIARNFINVLRSTEDKYGGLPQ